MKICAVFILLVAFWYDAFTQTISSPESVTLDPATGNYYISCPGNHTILKRDPAGNLSVFQPSSPWCSAPKGLCIVNNVLYATDITYVRAYDLDSGTVVMSLLINDAVFLNDIVADGNGQYLYITDTQGWKIYKLDITSQTATPWLTTGIVSPNGIYCDYMSNRLLIVEFSSNATIKSIDMTTQAILTLVANPPAMLDGITRDSQGYWYISSWATNKVYRYHHSLLGTPLEVSVSGTVNGPADVYVNRLANPEILAIPSMNNNQVYFVPLVWTDLNENCPPETPRLYPNPGRQQTTLEYFGDCGNDVKIRIVSMQGQEVGCLRNQLTESGLQRQSLETGQLIPGSYLVWLQCGNKDYRLPLTIN